MSKCDGETSPRQFSKISSLNISLNQQFETSYNLFLLYVQVKNYRKVLKLTCTPHIKRFWKIKSGWERVSLNHFQHNFYRKYFYTLRFINWPNFIVWMSLLFEILDNMWIFIYFFSSLWHRRKAYFFIKSFSYMNK